MCSTSLSTFADRINVAGSATALISNSGACHGSGIANTCATLQRSPGKRMG